MERYRRAAHTHFDIKSNLVWITKYRKKLLSGEVGLWLRQMVRTICPDLEAEILKGHADGDHVHVSCPPHVSTSYLVQRFKGESSRALMQECNHQGKLYRGRQLWTQGSFVAVSGNVSDEVIIEYIRT